MNPIQDLMMEFLLLIELDLHEHLKEDACDITAFMPPVDQKEITL